ncbi:MAG: asparaginase, partial [Vulcanimicrobiota bacterium]
EIEEICQQNPDGIVITHGTDTMAYTASMLSFMIENPPCPIILTGSQIPMAEKGSDGPDNLLNSVQFAAYGPTGIYIVFNGKIIHGVNSSKFYTSRKNAFVSVNRKPAGRFLPYSDISTNSVKVKKIDWPGRKKGNSVFNTRISDRVLMVRITPGFKPQWLEEFCNPDEVDGIILLGYGLGGVPNREPLNLLPVIEKFIDKQIPVVVLSQCPYEAPDLKVYEVGLKALKMGVIPGGKMTKEAALTKLMWVLGQTRDMKRIKQMMTENLRGEL